jgi:hypothetical protein
MATATVHITPFHVGWRVRTDAQGHRRETVTGERARAIEIARYHATRYDAPRVVVLHEDGSVEEELSTT